MRGGVRVVRGRVLVVEEGDGTIPPDFTVLVKSFRHLCDSSPAGRRLVEQLGAANLRDAEDPSSAAVADGSGS